MHECSDSLPSRIPTLCSPSYLTPTIEASSIFNSQVATSFIRPHFHPRIIPLRRYPDQAPPAMATPLLSPLRKKRAIPLQRSNLTTTKRKTLHFHVRVVIVAYAVTADHNLSHNLFDVRAPGIGDEPMAIRPGQQELV